MQTNNILIVGIDPETTVSNFCTLKHTSQLLHLKNASWNVATGNNIIA